jgi:hypothetical protein
MVIHLNAAGFVLGVVAEAAGGSSNRVGLGAVEGRHDEPADSRVGGSKRTGLSAHREILGPLIRKDQRSCCR